MKNDSNGPTGILYWAMGALVVAVSLLAYFVVAGSPDEGAKKQPRFDSISAPARQ